MLELPMNRIGCFGGGFVLSAVSKARISFSHLAGLLVVSAARAWLLSARGQRRQGSSKPRKMRRLRTEDACIRSCCRLRGAMKSSILRAPACSSAPRSADLACSFDCKDAEENIRAVGVILG